LDRKWTSIIIWPSDRASISVQQLRIEIEASFDQFISEVHGHGIANCFRIFNKQNELPDPKKVLDKVNSKFKNLATKTKKIISATSAIRTLAWSRGSLVHIAQRCIATYRSC
jgi:ferric iron reductase protein FhuF